jgi:hypothetical protein
MSDRGSADVIVFFVFFMMILSGLLLWVIVANFKYVR